MILRTTRIAHGSSPVICHIVWLFVADHRYFLQQNPGTSEARSTLYTPWVL
jgi:hypothetical protein